jgi:hypothetical protein
MTQTKVGWRAYVVTQVVNAVDADAQAFIAAAGITNLTQASAINTLVNDLKTYGLWTKMKALYPMVGGSATSHKFNLKDPRDLDAAYRLVFNGGWVHTSTGALPNGTTGWADTKLIPSVNYNVNNNSHVSFYSRTNSSNSGNNEIGCTNTNVTPFVSNVVTTFRSDQSNKTFLYSNTSNGVSFTDTNSLGFYISNRINTQANGYKNGVSKGSNTVSDEPRASISIVIGANNANTGITQYSSKESAFASIGDGLTDSEAANYYTSVQKFQTTLGRQIGSPIVSDTDAQAFINAAGLTDLGQANAVNTLVVDLKAAGVWTKMKALYPFVGGSATSHKFNLKDPRDLDAAFRLVFNGGWVHSSTGAKPNGTTAYADTKLGANLLQTNNHLAFYSRTATLVPAVDMGVYDFLPAGIICQLNIAGNYISGPVGSSANFTTTTIGNGFWLGTKISDTERRVYLNGTNQSLATASYSQTLPSINMYLGARNKGGVAAEIFSNKECAFSSIGDGLSAANVSNLYTAVQKYQTSLGRQIGTPVLAEGQTAGLLDTYSSAAAAYSLRKLRNGYVGNAIRVRRSSDNAEQDIAFNTSGGLDTVSLLAFVGGGNGFVTTWYDQSGNGVNISQSTAANQPQIVNGGSIRLLNNKPSIYFDGSSTYFNSSTQTVLSTGGGGYSIFGTAKPSGTSGSKCLFYIGSATGNNGVGFNLSNTQPRHYWFGNDFDTSQTFSDTNAIYAVSYDGSKRYTAINNVTQSQNATGKNTVSPILMVGKLQGYGQTFIGLQSELIIYNSYKDTSITNIYGSMNSYYSIY